MASQPSLCHLYWRTGGAAMAAWPSKEDLMVPTFLKK
jgi:hypothetical protein